MQAQLQESRAADGVLNQSQAALGRVGRRTSKIGEERDVVVRRVEIGMIEHVERVSPEIQPEALLEGELLGQAHVKANLERTSEQVATRTTVERLEHIAPGCVASRHAVRAGGHKLRCKIGCIELTNLRR